MAAHKTPKVMGWLARHPRKGFYFTPVGLLAQCRGDVLLGTDPTPPAARRLPLRRNLQAAINRYLEVRDDGPKPFVSTKSADTILDKTSRIPAPIRWISAPETVRLIIA